MTYEQVRAIVSRPYPDIAKPIAQLEEKVARFRDQLTQAVAHRMIEDDAAVAMNRELAVADYCNTRSWVAMIEGDVPGSQKALRESESRCQSVCKRNQAAALISFPLSYFVPRANFLDQVRCIQFSKAHLATIIVFPIKQVALTCDLNRLEAAVRSLTGENGDSTILDVLRYFQCSRGKS